MDLDKAVYAQQVPPTLGHINVGYGGDISIANVARAISDIVGFKGELVYDSTKPDGAPRKLVDSSRIKNIGWKPLVSLQRGLELAYQDFLEHNS